MCVEDWDGMTPVVPSWEERGERETRRRGELSFRRVAPSQRSRVASSNAQTPRGEPWSSIKNSVWKKYHETAATLSGSAGICVSPPAWPCPSEHNESYRVGIKTRRGAKRPAPRRTPPSNSQGRFFHNLRKWTKNPEKKETPLPDRRGVRRTGWSIVHGSRKRSVWVFFRRFQSTTPVPSCPGGELVSPRRREEPTPKSSEQAVQGRRGDPRQP